MSDVEKAERRIGIPPFEITAEPPRACFEVSTSARLRGDDERVVWELSSILDAPGELIDWTIEWERSEF